MPSKKKLIAALSNVNGLKSFGLNSLCNRIKTIASGIVASNETSRKVVVKVRYVTEAKNKRKDAILILFFSKNISQYSFLLIFSCFAAFMSL
uniref:hypothetical protein n=1 Tax=Wolbachia endosymbiont (group B) of Eucosma cana TaxID=2954012 RepID=UPI00222795B6|nr:hypothetical protein [Wolbachia endosymbiont (group B) of Eucosma cana]